MRSAIMIGAALCSAAIADETHSTFGADWDYSWAWPIVGQTLSVPQELNTLESFTFVGEAWGPNSVPYLIAVFDWDTEAQHVIGNALFLDGGIMVQGDVATRTHAIDLDLPEGESIAVIVAFFPEEDMNHGVGYTLDNAYFKGSFVGTTGEATDPWDFPEGNSFDLVFAAEWCTCPADMYDDGILNILDFLAFEAAFKMGDMEADCDQNGVLNVLDFVCFQQMFLEGC